MNKIWIVVMTLVFPLVFALQANAQIVSTESVKAEPKFSASLGLGSSYSLGEKEAGVIKDYKGSLVSSLRLGYSLSKYVEVQGEYSSGTKFERKIESASSSLNNTRSYSTFTLNLKAGVPTKIKGFGFYPYIVMGVGKANTNWSGHYKSAVTEFSFSENFSGKCSKAGIGVEVNLHKDIYLFSELNNWRVNWTNSFDQQRYVYFYKQILAGLTLKF
jgi:hypothetical protein